ncbi:hypothetical protein [Muriicola sp. Z0-33]|uniref:hypothetical protein n=1 Tax=Muriicola sp. Z0-33 TaxID=2816957 RepID=UPI002238AE09|nr:hypothetical protein [Muriicola sp. Z0-33]MCW5518114.1 hypothetical protein [Muriicola sp. Z0-33]
MKVLRRNMNNSQLKHNWLAFFVELIIVFLSVSVAFQLNVKKAQSDERSMKIYLIKNLKAENQTNLDEFNLLSSYRKYSEDEVKALLNLLVSNNLELDRHKIENSIMNIINIREERIQTAYLDAYLNNYLKDYTLNTELLKLKSTLQELIDHRKRYYDWKKEHLWEYLIEDIDLVNSKIISYEKISNIQFRNSLMFLLALEKGQELLHRLALEQMKLIDEKLQIKN